MEHALLQPTASPTTPVSLPMEAVEHGNNYVHNEFVKQALLDKYRRLTMVCRDRLQDKDPATWKNFSDDHLRDFAERIGRLLLIKFAPQKLSVDFTNDASIYFTLLKADKRLTLEVFMEDSEVEASSFGSLIQGGQITKSFEGNLAFVLRHLMLAFN